MGLRLDGYIRVSRVGGRDGEGYISPEVQREAIQAYAVELKGEIVAWHDDQDHTGGNTDRPGFQVALERLRTGQSDGLVVMKIDRFARSVADGSAIVREIVEADQVFASCHERIDPRTPEGKYMLTSFLANAELFLDQIKASWKGAKARSVARGAHIGPTPIGYRRRGKEEARSGTLYPDPVYGPAIGDLFTRAARMREGDTALGRWMTDRAPRAAGRPWQPSEIRRWLSNRVYLGEVHYGDLANTDAHEPLTDEATWLAVQREPGVQRTANSPFLLSGVARCARCRYSMGGFSYGGAGHATPVYRCSNKECDGRSVIVSSKLEEFVVGQVRDVLATLRLEGSAEGTSTATLTAELAELDAEVQAFAMDLEARRALGEAGWQAALRARLEPRDRKRTELDDGLASNALASLAHQAADWDSHDLRDLLAGVRHVFVRRRPRGAPVADRALIVWTDEPTVIDVPRPHGSATFGPIDW